MAKKKRASSAKLNGQEYVPPYQFWVEKEFWADEYVSRGMNWIQRHFYRALLQAAFYGSSRPYLPTNDDELWIIADTGTKENWLENKNAIMPKFQLTKVNGVEVWSHKRLLRDWNKLVEYSEKQSKRRKQKKSGTPCSFEAPEGIDFEEDDGIEADESAL